MGMIYDEIITDIYLLQQGYMWYDGFVFTIGEQNPTRFNRLIVRNPKRARASDVRLGFSERSLEEHIQFINQHNIQKAMVFCENLSFINECPQLSDLVVFPAYGASNRFDYSALYKMPNLKQLDCTTEYGDDNSFHTTVDYSKIKGLESVVVHGNGHIGYRDVLSLKKIWIWGDKNVKKVTDINSGSALEELIVYGCGLKSLEGIERHKKIKKLSLDRCIALTDISQLKDVGETLTTLYIENCGKINDFSVFEYLTNLEYLQLDGCNSLPNLDFLMKMPKLKVFIFSMNVENGDLTNCLNVPYAICKNRKHFNLKNHQLPKNMP